MLNHWSLSTSISFYLLHSLQIIKHVEPNLLVLFGRDTWSVWNDTYPLSLHIRAAILKCPHQVTEVINFDIDSLLLEWETIAQEPALCPFWFSICNYMHIMHTKLCKIFTHADDTTHFLIVCCCISSCGIQIVSDPNPSFLFSAHRDFLYVRDMVLHEQHTLISSSLTLSCLSSFRLMKCIIYHTWCLLQTEFNLLH